MWTDTTRAHLARAGLILPSDLTNAEWALLMPSSRRHRIWGDCTDGQCGGLSRRSSTSARRHVVVDVAALLPVSINRQSPVLPVARQRGLADADHSLQMTTHEIHGREASPGADVIDSEQVQ